jgi:hypothetical protein
MIHRLPYRYYYKFLSAGDARPRKLMIHDWEIGALFWNCLKRTDGDETAANMLVRQKYFDEFQGRDLHLFLGTTKKHHNVAPNPFVIVGLFYPPKNPQMSLFNSESSRCLL